jgi:hypothetical protein
MGSNNPSPEKGSTANNEIECRKLFLDFYSSQLNTHGSLIIGFSVVVFTLIGIWQAIRDILWWQNLLLCFSVFVASFSLWYLLFRHLAYGTLTGAVMFTEWKPDFDQDQCKNLPGQFANEMMKYVKKWNSRILLIVPTEFFISGTGKMRYGVVICLVLSILTAAFSYFLIG